jgi:hypothetical protein
MFNARILSFGILTNEYRIDIVIRGLEAGNGSTWSDICEEIESATERQVERDMTFAD